ncbi:DUF3394 domain-containing protein [Comamonadaceae bacterium M7527]|nr:DUF3394 domain-containing protein [Comamonadaceae bacterium M7527]
MLLFAAATQGYFLVRSKLWESAALLLITFTLFRPGFWWDMVYPPFAAIPAAQMAPLIEAAPANTGKRVWVEGLSLEGNEVRKGVLLPLGPEGSMKQRLAHSGLSVMTQGDGLLVSMVRFGSKAEKLGVEQGFVITQAEVSTDRPDKEWMFVPALGLLALVLLSQRRRKVKKA